jgi:bifunctional non-homologous end joining protein LigD
LKERCGEGADVRSHASGSNNRRSATRQKRTPRRDSESTLKLPAFRPPQLATLTPKVPAGDGWLFEMKYDGYRAMAAIAGDQVRIYTRNGHDCPTHMPTRTPTGSTVA